MSDALAKLDLKLGSPYQQSLMYNSSDGLILLFEKKENLQKKIRKEKILKNLQNKARQVGKVEVT